VRDFGNLRLPCPFRHPGLVPGSNVPRKKRLARSRNLGCRNKQPWLCGVERRVAAGDSVEDGDHLSHGGDEGEFEGLTLFPESFVEAGENRIARFYGAEGCHVEDVAQCLATTSIDPGASMRRIVGHAAQRRSGQQRL
jgi:hypothetical protein